MAGLMEDFVEARDALRSSDEAMTFVGFIDFCGFAIEARCGWVAVNPGLLLACVCCGQNGWKLLGAIKN